MTLRPGLRTSLDRSGLGYLTTGELYAQLTALDSADTGATGATGPAGATGPTGPATAPGTLTWTTGAGSPEGVVTAPVGSLYSNSSGGANTTLYVKTTGAGNTGWTAK
jgi:hypothetical protein